VNQAGSTLAALPSAAPVAEGPGEGACATAAALAEAAGMKVVMNLCPKIEYGRLSSEISWIGVNSRTLSSKRAQILGKGVQRMGLSGGTMQGGATEATDRAQKKDEGS
jgi:hypothetical protein